MAVAKPPAKVVKECTNLAAGLDEVIPAKHLDRNLLIGTWNIRAFGDLADTWTGNGDGKVKRDLRALAHITELVSRFDVVAIQEVKGNLRAIRHMMKALGPEWGFILTDATRGSAGNDERLAFVFDMRRVKPSGLACELVLSDEDLGMAGAGELSTQFARTPYAVSFQSADQTFILVTLHVLWGKVPGDRLPELKRIAEWVADWAEEIQSWGQNLIVLGDFNIDRKDDAAYEAFTSSGLRPPEALDDIPRTLLGQKKKAFYDQIAWFTDKGGPRLTLDYTGRAGGFDFLPHVFTEMEPADVTWRMSDHYPLWCEFGMTRVGSIKAPAKLSAVAAARKATSKA